MRVRRESVIVGQGSVRPIESLNQSDQQPIHQSVTRTLTRNQKRHSSRVASKLARKQAAHALIHRRFIVRIPLLRMDLDASSRILALIRKSHVAYDNTQSQRQGCPRFTICITYRILHQVHCSAH